MRLKTYRKEAAKHDCVDMINKLNEIGANCPTFVAANLNHIPITTADSFDLSKLCRNIEMVRELENSVTNSFATLSCLQSDFSVVLKKCSKIDLLIDEMAALKLSIAAKDGGLPLELSVSMQKTSKQTTTAPPLEQKSAKLKQNQSLMMSSLVSTMKTIKMTCNRLMLTIPQRHTNIRRYRMTA